MSLESSNSETSMWVAVIDQALHDATLGIIHSTNKKRSRICGTVSSYSALKPIDVWQARDFLSGKTGMLEHICDICNMDYEYVLRLIKFSFDEAIPHMPVEWRPV
jgi:hypothetical protein